MIIIIQILLVLSLISFISISVVGLFLAYLIYIHTHAQLTGLAMLKEAYQKRIDAFDGMNDPLKVN